ncbi:MAG: hypothetical protein OXH04_14190 [Acidobacteria bacterium]|nr:hypothetical protein [Acidobacteriota bacterium]
MEAERASGVRGWLLVYVVCSIPVSLFFAAGLAGWFLDYPIALWLAIFLVLASPLLLIVLRSSAAPRWNIAALWIAALSITVRIVHGVLFQRILDGRPRLTGEEMLDALPVLLGIVLFALGWAAAWTKYFRTSVRVSNTFA